MQLKVNGRKFSTVAEACDWLETVQPMWPTVEAHGVRAEFELGNDETGTAGNLRWELRRTEAEVLELDVGDDFIHLTIADMGPRIGRGPKGRLVLLSPGQVDREVCDEESVASIVEGFAR